MIPQVPKQRPWHKLRYWVFALLLIVAVTIGWAVIETRKVQFAQPVIDTDHRALFREELQQRVELGPGDGAEAWKVLMQMLLQIEETVQRTTREAEGQDSFEPRFEYDAPGPQFDYVRVGSYVPGDADIERMTIEQLRDGGVMELFARFVELGPGFNPDPPQGTLFTEFLPHLTRSRLATRMRAASMRIALEEGDHEEVAAAFEQMLALGQTMSLQPGLINMLVGAAIHNLAQQELQQELMESQIDESALHQMLASLDRHRLLPASDMILGELYGYRDGMQEMFSDNGRGNGYLIGDAELMTTDIGQRSFAKAFMSRFVLADRRETLAMIERAFEAMIAEAAKPVGERFTTFDIDTFTAELGLRYRVVAMMLPAIDRSIVHVDFIASHREATRIMLALAIYHEQNGSYPDALTSLAPGILTQVPVDPINGGPFGYRLLTDDEENRPYLLYSFGWDGQDNDGKMVEGEYNLSAPMLNSRDGLGYDYVFNRSLR